MIAYLAAVPKETELIRQAMASLKEVRVHGLDMYSGTVDGVSVCLTHSGVGKAASAAAAVTLMTYCEPETLFLFGSGGAYPGSGLKTGDLALATSEIFGDEGVDCANGFKDLETVHLPMRSEGAAFYNTWPMDQVLAEWAYKLLLKGWERGGAMCATGPFVTVSTCTGTLTKAKEIESRTGGICENMEGAAAALACQQLAKSMIEIRGISNIVENRNLAQWDLAAGMTAAQLAVLEITQHWQDRPT